MTLALWLQWGLLIGFALLLALAVLAGARRVEARPWAFAAGVLAASHLVYYVLFLVWSHVLDGQATMLYSITLRYMVMFMTLFVLVFALRGRWTK